MSGCGLRQLNIPRLVINVCQDSCSEALRGNLARKINLPCNALTHPANLRIAERHFPAHNKISRRSLQYAAQIMQGRLSVQRLAFPASLFP